MSAASVPYVLDRLPQTDDELYELVKTLWGITIPWTQVCPNHTTPFQAFADAYFARYPVSVWKASRGLGGKSRTLAYLGLTEATLLGAKVNILGGSGAQSVNVQEAMGEGWNHELSPRWMIEGETQYETRLSNGAKVRALLASTRAVRGPHPQRLRMDEIDEMELLILDAALGQPMEDVVKQIETQTVLSSTHHYADATMTAMIERAGDRGWPVYEWCIAKGSKVTTVRGDVPIEDVISEDTVLTRRGWKRVQHRTFMGVKDTVVVTLDDGRQLHCTADHRVATASGWVEAASLTSSSIVQTLARTAVPASIGSDVEVPAGVDMTSRTMGLGGPAVVPTMSGGVDTLQVVEVNAEPGAADVIDLDASRDGAVGQSLDSSVGQLLSVGASVDQAISILGADSSLPDEAAILALGTREQAFELRRVVSVTHGARVAVYDIGVEDEHEFVADGFVVHNCWKESNNKVDGWLTDGMVARTRDTVTQRMWEVEYDLQEPSHEGRAIDTDAVEKMFRKDLGEYDRKLAGREMWLPIGAKGSPFEEPERRAEYITGVDWAKEQDFTVISVYRVDCTPWRLVAYGRFHRQPWPVMVNALNKTANAYGGLVAHDGTGIGNVVDDLIDYERRLIKKEIMVGRHRMDMLTDYINAVEKGLVEAPRITSAYTEHKYATYGDIYEPGKSENHLPDSIASGALAWSRRKKTAKKAGPVPVGTRASSPWRM